MKAHVVPMLGAHGADEVVKRTLEALSG